MPLTTETAVVARCDLSTCSAVRYGTKSVPPVGYYVTVERLVDVSGTDDVETEGHTGQLYACSLPHAKKAMVERLDDPSHLGVTNYREGKDNPPPAVHERAEVQARMAEETR